MYFADENLLYNPRLRRAYRIEGGVPVMLAERVEPVQEREHERLLMRARDGAAVLSAPGGPAAALASLSPSWRPHLYGLFAPFGSIPRDVCRRLCVALCPTGTEYSGLVTQCTPRVYLWHPDC
jgi:hypothetical protein